MLAKKTLVLAATGLALTLGQNAMAQEKQDVTQEVSDIQPRDGWVVKRTDQDYETLVESVQQAAEDNDMGPVTEAGPTEAAADRDIKIPGNRVIGVFNNKFAVRILRASTAAMIEAPIIMYVTENEDGTASLSYKKPTYVYRPYMEEGGKDLEKAAEDLDDAFEEVAADALDQADDSHDSDDSEDES